MSIAAYQGVCPTCHHDHRNDTFAPTPRETADHADHIGDATTMIDHAELARLAEAATPGDLDTVPNPPSEYGGHSTGWLECPCCAGAGEVQGATFTNFDGVAIGVQFFGIGAEFGAYEAFFRAANPATVLELLSEIAALRGEVDRLAEELHNEIMVCAGKSCDADVAERQRDELRKALEEIADEAPYRSGYCQSDVEYGPTLSADEMQAVARQALANQGADQ